LDEQVNTIFNDQKRQQKAQSILNEIRNDLSALDDKAPADTAFPVDPVSSADPVPLTDPVPSTDALTRPTNVDAMDPDNDPRAMRPRPAVGSGRDLRVPGSYTNSPDQPGPQGTNSSHASVSQFQVNIEKHLKDLSDIDPKLAATLRDRLSREGQILSGDPLKYGGQQVVASKEVLEGIGKDLESQASLNMIRLQSIMSTRQTAVQLATNLIASLGETTKAIVTNVGR